MIGGTGMRIVSTKQGGGRGEEKGDVVDCERGGVSVGIKMDGIEMRGGEEV